MKRPEKITLTQAQRERVRERAKERDFICGGCGSGQFTVGDTLYLGFLFLDEETDVYMVALTCQAPDCQSPRTGIKLHEHDLFGVDNGTR